MKIRKIVATLLIALMLLPATMPAALAGLVTTDAVAIADARGRIASALDRQDVEARLQALGVRRDEVQARVDALTDDEVRELADRIDSLPAGGDGFVGALVFVFLVLLITDIVGLTKVFPFTRSIR